jgi:GT2 family glycosyltransferase
MCDMSIIIVSWNAQALLYSCLSSLQDTAGSLSIETVVVDNGSKDGSAEMVAREFPDAVLLRSEENLGFAKANNLGMKRARGRFLALINSDVVVHDHCLEILAAYLTTHSDVGLVGPQILGRDGRIQFTSGKSPTIWNTFCRTLALDRALCAWPGFSGFQMRNSDRSRCQDVEVLSGCFWVARREAVRNVGDLDERFFFYGEDLDWCKRFRNAGWKVTFVPQASAVHFGGGSSANNPLHYSVELLRANILYWRKHHGIMGPLIYRLLALGEHSLRFVARALSELGRSEKNSVRRQKLREHLICIRWLLTGRGI